MKYGKVLIGICLISMLAGCHQAVESVKEVEEAPSILEGVTNETPAPSLAVPPDETTDETPDPSEALTEEESNVVFEVVEESMKNEEEVMLLEVQGNLPVVTLPGNKIAEEKINTYYKERKQVNEEVASCYFEDAKEDYEGRTEEEREWWNEGYGFGETFTLKRLDDKVMSFENVIYSYTGGAHPGTIKGGESFNVQTGDRLMFSDVVTDEKAAIKYINEMILEQTKDKKYEGYFFEGYEASIKEILTEDTWYLSEEGLVIICNEYLITPHAVGHVDFLIPYADFSYLKEAYR